MRTVSLVAIFVWGSASVSLAAPAYRPSPTPTPISGPTSTGTDTFSPTPAHSGRPMPTPLSEPGLFPRADGEALLGLTTVFWPYAYVDGTERDGEGLVSVAEVLRDMTGLGSQPIRSSTTASTESVQTRVWGPMPVVPSAGVARGKGVERQIAVVAAVLGGLGSVMLCVAACGALVRARACGWGKGGGGHLWLLTEKGQQGGLKAEDRVLDIRRADKELLAGTRVSDLSVYSATTSHSEDHGLGSRAQVSVAAPVPPGRASAVLLSAGEFFTLPSAVSSLMGLGHVRTRSAPEGRGRGSEMFGHRRVVSSGSAGEMEWDIVQA